MTIPTKLILLRILLIPVFLVLFFSHWEYARWASVIVFAIASVSDLFDGVIARARGQMTAFVKTMDPLADKLLICSALIVLVSTQEIAAWLVILIVCRDFIITALRLFAASQNKILGAVITGKINTACQMFLIIAILIGASDIVISILFYAVAALVIISTAENFIRDHEIIKKLI